MKKMFCLIAVFVLMGTMNGGIDTSLARAESDAPGLPTMLVNTQEISKGTLERITVSYSAEDITILESLSDNIVLKEYMNVDQREYYATVWQEGDDLTISSGKRPERIGANSFRAKIEIYLPAEYHGSLFTESTSGSVHAKQDLILSEFKADSKSGSILLKQVEADTIQIHAASGSVEVGMIAKTSEIETQSGSIHVLSLSSAGTFTAGSGSIRISCSEDVGNIVAKTSSGNIEMEIPENLSAHFSAKTNSGDIVSPFTNPGEKREKKVTGTFGRDAVVTIDLETSSGNIKVS